MERVDVDVLQLHWVDAANTRGVEYHRTTTVLGCVVEGSSRQTHLDFYCHQWLRGTLSHPLEYSHLCWDSRRLLRKAMGQHSVRDSASDSARRSLNDWVGRSREETWICLRLDLAAQNQKKVFLAN